MSTLTTNRLPTTSRILLAFFHTKSTVSKLKNIGKEYDPLIDEIMTLSAFGRGTIKVLYEKLNISPGRLTKWIEDLYKDFIELIESEATVMSFQVVRVLFCIELAEEYIAFYCQVPFLPRVGEQVDLPFVSALFNDRTALYVKKITHIYEDNKTEVVIDLNTIEPFLAHLKQRALFEKKLYIGHIHPYELKETLENLYGSPT